MDMLHEFCFWWFGEDTGQCAGYMLGAGAFLLAALYWFVTGRWPMIGLLVVLAWTPINLLFGLLWLLGLPLALLDRILFPALKVFLCVIMLFLSAQPGAEQEGFLFLAGLLVYLFFYDVPIGFFKRGALFMLQPLRYPAPRLRQPKPAFRLPGWKRKEKEKNPLPVVKIAAATGGSVPGEKEMTQQLPRHLRELLSPSPPMCPMKSQTDDEGGEPMMEEEAPS